MEQKIGEKIDLYCEIYEQAYKKVSKVSPDNAREVTGRIFGEVARDLRSELISQLRRDENNQEGGTGSGGSKGNKKPATEKQRHALHKFGVETLPEDLSLKDASDILNELIGLAQDEDSEALNERVKELNENYRSL
ncbi:MAG: hypothetical protein PHD13_04120 [Methanocellales archaeon]|nr:hypothetical protein [Methanocellales archaeon]MDD3292103.1 hypothetical protein [Methanocellales archaeon]MDD5235340.1 hypothetical protein [Methanocellales archaeon]MDD5485712.1 hypothetical protein [Methanocellales archaeon]